MIRHSLRPFRVGHTVLLWALLGGCSAMSKPFPGKNFFAIDAGRPEAAGRRVSESTLRVRQVRVASPYDARAFVYKIGGARFETDYYNGFIAEPAAILTGELVEWLAGSGLFGSVVASDNGADHRFILEGNVRGLYGDYSVREAPKAVIEVKFFLLDDGGAKIVIPFKKGYKKTASCKDDSPAALVAAWGKAYREILAELTADLGKLGSVGS